MIESAAYRQFYMHGTGHWLGRDVHDVGDYLARPTKRRSSSPTGSAARVVQASPRACCEPGMVVTIEPGLYVRPAEGVPERFWNIGIRIEDDAVVTADGLRADQPRRAGRGRRDRSADARLSGPRPARAALPA